MSCFNSNCPAYLDVLLYRGCKTSPPSEMLKFAMIVLSKYLSKLSRSQLYIVPHFYTCGTKTIAKKVGKCYNWIDKVVCYYFILTTAGSTAQWTVMKQRLTKTIIIGNQGEAISSTYSVRWSTPQCRMMNIVNVEWWILLWHTITAERFVHAAALNCEAVSIIIY